MVRKTEDGATLQTHTDYIHGVMGALAMEGVVFNDADGNFSKRYAAYVKRFNKAIELVRQSNDITQELYPIEDPRQLIAETHEYFLLDGEESQAFLEEFGMKEIHTPTTVKAYFHNKARVEDAPLPDTKTKYYKGDYNSK